MRDIIVVPGSKDVKIPTERYSETRTMLKNVVIQEGAMETYTKAAPDYINKNGEAVITKDMEALVKGLIQRCAMHNISPMAVLYHTFVSIDDPKHNTDLHYLNTDVDPTQIRKPKMLEFEQAVRYLGLPYSIEALRSTDFIRCDPADTVTVPIGVHYAIMCKPGDPLMRWRSDCARVEFVIPWTDELKVYLPDMENRYYAYKDGEESGWRL